MLIALVALLAGVLAATTASFDAPSPRWSGIDPAFALLWLLGAACAIGAATQAKFHRLAALILTGGAGLVSCVSFVWLSAPDLARSEEHTSELQSLMRISYAVFCMNKQRNNTKQHEYDKT